MKPDTPHPLRVLVADGRTLVREGLCLLIDRLDGIHAFAGVDRFDTVERLLDEGTIDVVVMDAELPDWTGADPDTLRQRHAATPPFIVLSRRPDVPTITYALQCGASGVLLRDADAKALENAIHTVAAGNIALCPSTAATLVAAYVRRHELEQELAGNESVAVETRRILALLIEGKTLPEVIRETRTSVETVDERMKDVMHRFGIQDTNQLVLSVLSKE